MHTPHFSRTRIAPTPSGFLHMGNAASFLLTAELAKRYGAKILLRIDDLDRARVRPEYIRDVFDTLIWLGINWDEGPRDPEDFERSWSQAHRKLLYAAALDKLKEAGALFACTCSRSQLAAEGALGYSGNCLHKNIPLDTPGASLRIRTDDDAHVRMIDMESGERRLNIPVSVKHAVVRKKDGEAAYHLSSVVDDLHFGVDLIVRGEDLFDSTLIQLHIAAVLGESKFADISFHHHPLLLGEDGLKMSKSAGAFSIKAIRESGITLSELLARLQQSATTILNNR